MPGGPQAARWPRSAPVPLLLLFEVAEEESADDADEGTERGDLGRERAERGDEGHRERPDQGGAEEAEGEQHDLAGVRGLW